LPLLPAQMLAALCYATSVDEEIQALVCGLPERNRELVFARWGFRRHEVQTLDELGREFGITRERTRQLVAATERQIADSGLRLPAASAVVQDLDEAGGALTDADYALVLRYGAVSITPTAIGTLPVLHQMKCVPLVVFDRDAALWLTASGRERVVARGEARRMRIEARHVAGRHLRRVGAVPFSVLDTLSPFGREHATALIADAGFGFIEVGDHSLRLPVNDSALLRQCRKTLVATGLLAIDELHHGLRRNGFNVTRELLNEVLVRCPDFVVRGIHVQLARSVKRDGVLSPAEAAGIALFHQNGGAMLWWDFLEAMVQAGFSAAMATIVLRRPAIRRVGPSTYALRGGNVGPGTLAELSARRRKLARRSAADSVVGTDGGHVVMDYVLDRFALEGYLPAPRQLRGLSRAWTAAYPDGRVARLKVSRGVVGPLRSFFSQYGLMPRDTVRVVFDPAALHARFEVTGRRPASQTSRPKSHEEQILQALFGSDL
jgi:hypothetical protein